MKTLIALLATAGLLAIFPCNASAGGGVDTNMTMGNGGGTEPTQTSSETSQGARKAGASRGNSSPGSEDIDINKDTVRDDILNGEEDLSNVRNEAKKIARKNKHRKRGKRENA